MAAFAGVDPVRSTSPGAPGALRPADATSPAATAEAAGKRDRPARTEADQDAGSRNRPLLDDIALRREYDDYRTSLAGMKSYSVSYIRVGKEDDARALLAKLRSGADFGITARSHSTHPESASRSGRLGTFATCRWARDTTAMLDRLEPGQINPQPVKGTHGWGIYRLDAVNATVPLPWDAWRKAFLDGSFKPECPWVPPVTVAPSR